jgi:hypothetical protein
MADRSAGFAPASAHFIDGHMRNRYERRQCVVSAFPVNERVSYIANVSLNTFGEFVNSGKMRWYSEPSL